MATTALEVVPLLAMRRELRIEGEINPDDDARLIGQIGAAVSDVSLDASAPLVEQPETIEAAAPYRDRPVAFIATVVRVVRQVRYWTPGGSLRSAPDGVITDVALGRLQSDWPTTRRNWLYPPWPAGCRCWRGRGSGSTSPAVCRCPSGWPGRAPHLPPTRGRRIKRPTPRVTASRDPAGARALQRRRAPRGLDAQRLRRLDRPLEAVRPWLI